jgi:hypothetical protein
MRRPRSGQDHKIVPILALVVDVDGRSVLEIGPLASGRSAARERGVKAASTPRLSFCGRHYDTTDWNRDCHCTQAFQSNLV